MVSHFFGADHGSPCCIMVTPAEASGSSTQFGPHVGLRANSFEADGVTRGNVRHIKGSNIKELGFGG